MVAADKTDKPPFRADPTILPQTPTSDIGRYVNRTTLEYSANPDFSRAPSPEGGVFEGLARASTAIGAPGYTPGPIPGGEIPFPRFCAATYDQ